MDSRNLSTPKALAAIEKARKLLNMAYDKSVGEGERRNALNLAERALAPLGLTVEDLKRESTPDYLVGLKTAAATTYNQRGGVALAQKLAKGGWVAQDPRQHGYKNKGRGEDENP